MAIYKGDDRRRIVPEALVAVLNELIAQEPQGDPTQARVVLRDVRSRLCRLWGFPDPQGRASDIDVAHEVAEEDGDAIPTDF